MSKCSKCQDFKMYFFIISFQQFFSHQLKMWNVPEKHGNGSRSLSNVFSLTYCFYILLFMFILNHNMWFVMFTGHFGCIYYIHLKDYSGLELKIWALLVKTEVQVTHLVNNPKHSLTILILKGKTHSWLLCKLTEYHINTV